VEPKNVGRQLFSPSDVGRNKAQALAARFNALFGLAITAIPAMATPPVLQRTRATAMGDLGILVGAVDTASGRRVLHDALRTQPWHIWLDCGNHEASGQVCIGTTTDPQGLRNTVLGDACTALPAPSLQYPDLLAEPESQPAALACAEAMQANVQSLLINQAMSAIAAQYLAQVVLHRRLTTLQTVIDLDGLNMRSQPITLRALAQISGLSERDLTSTPRRKRARRQA
jgi:PRTRC genetic system ThiF family protein